MQIIQNRRDFLASLSRPAPRASLAPGDRSPTRAAGGDHDPAAP